MGYMNVTACYCALFGFAEVKKSYPASKCLLSRTSCIANYSQQNLASDQGIHACSLDVRGKKAPKIFSS